MSVRVTPEEHTDLEKSVDRFVGRWVACSALFGVLVGMAYTHAVRQIQKAVRLPR